VEDAMTAMGRGFDSEYFPDPGKIATYVKRYKQYNDLGHFIEQRIALTPNQQNISAPAMTEVLS
jgi:L-ribulokinase